MCLWKYTLLHLPWPGGCKIVVKRDSSITFLTGKVNPCHFAYLTLQLELCVRLCSDLGSLIWPSGKPLSDNRLCVRHFIQETFNKPLSWVSLTHGALFWAQNQVVGISKPPQAHALMFLWTSFAEKVVCGCENTLSCTFHGQVGAKEWCKEIAP